MFLPIVVGKLWKAMNANQKQIATVCNNVTKKIQIMCWFYWKQINDMGSILFHWNDAEIVNFFKRSVYTMPSMSTKMVCLSTKGMSIVLKRHMICDLLYLLPDRWLSDVFALTPAVPGTSLTLQGYQTPSYHSSHLCINKQIHIELHVLFLPTFLPLCQILP